MTWSWHYVRSDPTGMHDGPSGSQVFPTQSDAETWIGENWQELREAGVDAVTLFEEGREVYGPMSLHPQ